MNKFTIIIVIVLSIALAVSMYASYNTIPKISNTNNKLNSFSLVEADIHTPISYTSVGLYHINDFIKIANENNIHTIYYKTEGPSAWRAIYWFEIKNEERVIMYHNYYER